MSVIKKETIDVRRVGSALIGGNFTGNARGANALDIQTWRSGATQVASGSASVAIGLTCTASGNQAVAIGNTVTASNYNAVAIGFNATASGYYSTAAGYSTIASGVSSTAIGHGNTASGYQSLAAGHSNTASNYYTTALGIDCTASGVGSVAAGYKCTASDYNTTALGNFAEARIRKTTNICGPIINRKDEGENAIDAFLMFGGVEDILMTKEIDFKIVATHTITFPANCKLWWNKMGILATNIIVGGGNQPTVSYGITGNNAKQLAAAATTALTAAGKREIETPGVPEDGETSCVLDVTVASTYTTCKGRAYFKGMLIEDE